MLVHTKDHSIEVVHGPWGGWCLFVDGKYRPDLDRRLVLALLYGYAWSDWDAELVWSSEESENALLGLIEHGVERCEDWIRWAAESEALAIAYDDSPTVGRAREYQGHLENHPPL